MSGRWIAHWYGTSCVDQENANYFWTVNDDRFVLYRSDKQKHTQLSAMLSFVSKCYTVITLSVSICVEPVSFWNTGLVICVQAVLEHWAGHLCSSSSGTLGWSFVFKQFWNTGLVICVQAVLEHWAGHLCSSSFGTRGISWVQSSYGTLGDIFVCV